MEPLHYAFAALLLALVLGPLGVLAALARSGWRAGGRVERIGAVALHGRRRRPLGVGRRTGRDGAPMVTLEPQGAPALALDRSQALALAILLREAADPPKAS
ncbi:hypothetical protein [Coralloluteibacterium thermophilus]|uniref:Flagellar biosynthesis protein FliO n=1 Tax=Coralloluteibacterium thermophilum TaxID=2707049 RepID=A0ABV9NMG5_9GAMM